jgi:hypothetical protein
MLVVVYGRRVHMLFERERETLCGRCLKKTRQNVCTLEARSHVYFIEFGAEQLGRVAQCVECQNVVPVLPKVDDDGPKRTKRERWMDTFLAAHVLELTRADKGTLIGVVLVSMALAALVVLGVVATHLGPLDETANLVVLGATALVLVGLVRLAYVRVERGLGDAVFARSIRHRLATLAREHEITPRELAGRARLRGYARLAQHFEGARYALGPTPTAGPYR